MGIFFECSRAANSSVSFRIWPNSKQLKVLLHVIITWKYEKDRVKTAEKKWQHRFYFIIVLPVTMETSSRIRPNFKFIQALMYVIITSKYGMDPIKNSREKVATPFFPILVYGDFFRRSRAANSTVSGRIWLKFELI